MILIVTFIKIVDNLTEWVGKYVSWLNLLLVLLICLDVTFRYAFNFSKKYIIELEWHLFALVFLLAAANTFKHDRHIRVDLFYQNFSPALKKWVNILGSILFLIPWCLVVIYTSSHYALNSFSYHEGSPDPGGLPARYIIKFMISIGFSLLFLQTISYVLKQFFNYQEKA
jgi:TRAP-type mannitol/chloroaromatic compound transport system permease small subunit